MSRLKTNNHREAGISLIETLIAMAVLGSVAVIFLGGLTTTSKLGYKTDELSTAMSLAQLETEWVKSADYDYDATWYAIAPVPDTKDYIGYAVTVSASPLHAIDDGIQRIIIDVNRSGRQVLELETYKVDR